VPMADMARRYAAGSLDSHRTIAHAAA
jgi:hypothetical protein